VMSTGIRQGNLHNTHMVLAQVLPSNSVLHQQADKHPPPTYE
jgi:hypothetical protein